MFKNLSYDIKRYFHGGPDDIYMLFEQGLWAVCVYRFSRWTHTMNIPIISNLMRLVAYFFFKVIEMTTGISIPGSAQIGRGFYVGHFGGIVLHSNVKIGENCSIGPGVVIGTRALGKKGVPQIGNNVYIGTGAKILGGITIGDNARIGANAVVVKDVPAGATAVGIPAKILLKSS
jgi:serine O-acetyltransferase